MHLYVCSRCVHVHYTNFSCFTIHSALKIWLDGKDNLEILQSVFNSTSGYARLMSTHTVVAGRLVFIRFRAETGDAMGMNMLSKVRIDHIVHVYCVT